MATPTYLGKRSYKKVRALSAAWIASKESGERDMQIAHELRAARALYRKKYRPEPEAGVTMTDPVVIR